MKLYSSVQTFEEREGLYSTHPFSSKLLWKPIWKLTTWHWIKCFKLIMKRVQIKWKRKNSMLIEGLFVCFFNNFIMKMTWRFLWSIYETGEWSVKCLLRNSTWCWSSGLEFIVVKDLILRFSSFIHDSNNDQRSNNTLNRKCKQA